MEFEVSALIPATPEEIFDTWLDSRGHSEMTGSPANASSEAGAEFEAWNGYIRGRNIILERPARIVQSWRTSNFDASDPDSQIEVLLESKRGGSQLTIHHTRLPAHGSRYETGWPEHYFEPMRSYFLRLK
jgi:activator of HSP90 ATPase